MSILSSIFDSSSMAVCRTEDQEPLHRQEQEEGCWMQEEPREKGKTLV